MYQVLLPVTERLTKTVRILPSHQQEVQSQGGSRVCQLGSLFSLFWHFHVLLFHSLFIQLLFIVGIVSRQCVIDLDGVYTCGRKKAIISHRLICFGLLLKFLVYFLFCLLFSLLKLKEYKLFYVSSDVCFKLHMYTREHAHLKKAQRMKSVSFCSQKPCRQ